MEIWEQTNPDWLKDVPCKQGVIVKQLKLEIQKALKVFLYVYGFYGQKLTVTSCNDGQHMKESLHYTNDAFDLRTRGINGDILLKITRKAKSFLGKDYDIVLEKNHFHVEYDPK